MQSFTTIELDKPYILRFGMKEIELLENLLKISPIELSVQITTLKAKDIARALYAAISRELPKDMKLDKLIDLIDEYTSIGDVMCKLLDAVEISHKELLDRYKKNSIVPESGNKSGENLPQDSFI